MNQDLDIVAAQISRLRTQAGRIANDLDALIMSIIEMNRTHDKKRMDMALRKEKVKTATVTTVCDFYHIGTHTLFSRTRTGKVSAARQLICYLLHEHGDMSFPAIGAALGRDHSTVQHNRDMIERKKVKEPGFAKAIERLLTDISAKLKEAPLGASENTDAESNHDSAGDSAAPAGQLIDHLPAAQAEADSGIQNRERLAL